MKYNFAKVVHMASALGASVERQYSHIVIEAPHDFVWCCDISIHELVADVWDNSDITEVYKDLCERMELGIEPCPIEYCEWCGRIDGR
jgi:hypothetical protein